MTELLTLTTVVSEGRRAIDDDSPAAWLRRARQSWPQVFDFLDKLCRDGGLIYGGKLTYDVEAYHEHTRNWPSQRTIAIGISRDGSYGGSIRCIFSENGFRFRSRNLASLKPGDTPETNPEWFNELTRTFAGACHAFELA